jgi:hypothetical protein
MVSASAGTCPVIWYRVQLLLPVMVLPGVPAVTPDRCWLAAGGRREHHPVPAAVFGVGDGEQAQLALR